MSEKKPQLRDGKIVLSEEPLVLETPLERLTEFITPTKSFYVRTHFPIPKIDRNKWRLRIEGEVEKSFEINFDELTKLESKKIPAMLECAGNSRSFLEPKVKGVQWRIGGVGNAEWTGVPLSSLLDRAGIKSTACEIIFEGADHGKLEDPKSPRGEINFARSIPIEKASDVLLAHKMNGEELPPENGFPVRAIVPGWYAVASVKWLQRIIVTGKPFNGYYQTLDYAFWKRDGEQARLTALSEMQTKAVITKPAEGETIPANSNVQVRGAAWTGNGEIKKVELSVDSGKNWSDAKLLGESKANAWRHWEFDWKAPAKSGSATLIARATDSKGETQPLERDPDRGTYMINHLLPVNVTVK
jgi:DMSO/TMAO reductase YedYZ molybdopterin-dependent catalytic subunit